MHPSGSHKSTLSVPNSKKDLKKIKDFQNKQQKSNSDYSFSSQQHAKTTADLQEQKEVSLEGDV